MSDHGRPIVSMHRELLAEDALLDAGGRNEFLGQFRRLALGDEPALVVEMTLKMGIPEN